MNGPTTPEYRAHPLTRIFFLIVDGGGAKRRPSLLTHAGWQGCFLFLASAAFGGCSCQEVITPIRDHPRSTLLYHTAAVPYT